VQADAQRLDDFSERLRRGAVRALSESRRHLAAVSARLSLLSPRDAVRGRRGRIAEQRLRLETLARHRIEVERARLYGALGRLDSLSPLAVLDRGYSMTRAIPSGEIVRAAAQAPPGSLVEVTLRRALLTARVERARQRESGEAPSPLVPRGRKSS
jgi:exodeoxyribonuclease VII large subunit